MTTTTDELRELGRRWAAAEVAGGTDTPGGLVTDDFRIGHVFLRDYGHWSIAGIQLSLTARPRPPEGAAS